MKFMIQVETIDDPEALGALWEAKCPEYPNLRGYSGDREEAIQIVVDQIGIFSDD